MVEEPELGRKGHVSPPPSLPLPGYVQITAGAGEAERKTAGLVEGKRDSKRASLRRGMAGDGDGDEKGGGAGAVKKGRMRSRLSKWIHKLGSSSPSSSSSSPH
jgi:hypothetical protein